MTENFDFAFDLLMKVEGGYVNDAHDAGGETKFGISKKAFPNLNIAEITMDQAKEIYKQNYWNACRCDELPASFDVAVFDCAVNQGAKKAVLLLQKALDVTADGIIGDKTVKAAQAAGSSILAKFMLNRLYAYAELKDFAYYKKGWFNRLITVMGAI